MTANELVARALGRKPNRIGMWRFLSTRNSQGRFPVTRPDVINFTGTSALRRRAPGETLRTPTAPVLLQDAVVYERRELARVRGVRPVCAATQTSSSTKMSRMSGTSVPSHCSLCQTLSSNGSVHVQGLHDARLGLVRLFPECRCASMSARTKATIARRFSGLARVSAVECKLTISR